MSHTNSLIDQFKLKNGLESDYAAAKALGVRPNRISNYRTMTSHADDKTAIMLADALGLDRLTTIAKINQDRSTDVKEKAFWKNIASAAAIACLMLGSLPSQASVRDGLTQATYMHYAKYIAGRTLPHIGGCSVWTSGEIIGRLAGSTAIPARTHVS